MTFKEFLQKEELKGLYGNPVKSNPVHVDHAIDKKFFTSAPMTHATKQRGGSDIKRMMGRDKSFAKAIMPTGDFPKQITLKRNVPGEFFKSPKVSTKPKKVKSPLGVSST